MSGFDVTLGELAAGGVFVGDIRARLCGELSRLAALVDDVLDASWRGAAATAFTAAWDAWSAAAREDLDALSTMSTLLLRTGATYGSAEDASVVST